jgi:hypothetical protein
VTPARERPACPATSCQSAASRRRGSSMNLTSRNGIRFIVRDANGQALGYVYCEE